MAPNDDARRRVQEYARQRDEDARANAAPIPVTFVPLSPVESNARKETERDEWAIRPRTARESITEVARQIEKTGVTIQDTRRAVERRQIGAALYSLSRLAAQLEQAGAALAVAVASLTDESKAAPF